jgi:hypothetical protein
VNLVFEVALILSGVALLGLGAWLLLKSRVPSWCTGIWKWPLGDNLSPSVARLMGWSALLVGVASGGTAVLVALWDRSPAMWIASLTAVLFAIAGLFPWIWSVKLSRSKSC